MKQKLICGLLCLGLCLGLAQAAESGFSDVKDSDWFADYVSVCVDSGLMNGTDNGFEPEKTLTNGEAAALAARLRERFTGQAIPLPAPGETAWPWTYPYTSYLEKAIETLGGHEEAAQAVAAPVSPASRGGFMALLALAADGAEDRLSAINSITALPDTNNADVLAFYNAGILTGVDSYGTFAGEKTLTRAEAAAMVARLVKPELRLPFVPQTPSPSADPDSTGPESTEGAVMLVNGHPVPPEDLIRWLNVAAYQTDSFLASRYGVRLDLSDAEMLQTIMTQAQLQVAAQVLAAEKAKELGCEMSALAAALFPVPTRQELETYVKENDLLCAKHILVTDEQTAQAVLDGLEARPTLDQFNALLQVFGSDPGMEENPEGYLFSAGEMVEEFENGTRALELGSYTKEPVQSAYGYHIIWRLDPLDHPGLADDFRQAALDDQVNAWIRDAEITVDSAVLEKIDVAGNYSAFLTQLFGSQQ